ncbi:MULTISPECIES: DUF732 domain-containing protein [unclassified Rhodococcus (in: high G+C Gram-positive bacteria)]|uniref:DUF732 domain-containing protein n=1 Tax=unclassified Rhodococcus (in: high G+C Gram-positive bacteria) TaxID=192944 RepID=UPI001AE40B78
MKKTFAAVAAIGAVIIAGGCSNTETAPTEAATTEITVTTSAAPTAGRLADAAFLDELDARGMLPEDSDSRVSRGESICSSLRGSGTVEEIVEKMSWKYSASQARIIISSAQNVYCPETK